MRDAQIALEENNQLRSQLGQPENTRTTTTVSAEVIARSPGDWADTLTLDKGSSSGVNKDDLVTTVDGMLGFVSEVTDNTCEVTSITDPKMQCGALVTRTRETAIAEGDYNLMTRGALRPLLLALSFHQACTPPSKSSCSAVSRDKLSFQRLPSAMRSSCHALTVWCAAARSRCGSLFSLDACRRVLPRRRKVLRQLAVGTVLHLCCLPQALPALRPRSAQIRNAATLTSPCGRKSELPIEARLLRQIT